MSISTSKSLARFVEIIFERLIGFNPVFRNHIVTIAIGFGPPAEAAKTSPKKPLLITFRGGGLFFAY